MRFHDSSRTAPTGFFKVGTSEAELLVASVVETGGGIPSFVPPAVVVQAGPVSATRDDPLEVVVEIAQPRGPMRWSRPRKRCATGVEPNNKYPSVTLQSFRAPVFMVVGGLLVRWAQARN